MLFIDGNSGQIGKMTMEHFKLITFLQHKYFVVITKTDVCNEAVLQQTKQSLKEMLQTDNKKPFFIENSSDYQTFLQTSKIHPISEEIPTFQISSVTGHNLDLIRNFFYLLPTTQHWESFSLKPVVFYVDNLYEIPNVGLVVSGSLASGTISLNDELLFGPDKHGSFTNVKIHSIHYNRLPVKVAYAGQSISVAINGVEKDVIQKGQIITSLPSPTAVWEFDAEISLHNVSQTPANNYFVKNYQVIVHCRYTRQIATISEVYSTPPGSPPCENDSSPSSSDTEAPSSLTDVPKPQTVLVRFRYKYHPEFLNKNDRIVLTEGQTIGVGFIKKIHAIGDVL